MTITLIRPLDLMLAIYNHDGKFRFGLTLQRAYGAPLLDFLDMYTCLHIDEYQPLLSQFLLDLSVYELRVNGDLICVDETETLIVGVV